MATKDTGKVNIHGKEYETVASRVNRFREEYGNTYGIVTEIISADEATVVMKASIFYLYEQASTNALQQPLLVATGHAEENRSSSQINRTSALENAETSAIGRALAAFGIGGTEFASANEVVNAIHQQQKPAPAASSAQGNPMAPASDKQKALITKLLGQNGIPSEDMTGHLIEVYGVDKPSQMTQEQASFVIDELIGEGKTRPTNSN